MTNLAANRIAFRDVDARVLAAVGAFREQMDSYANIAVHNLVDSTVDALLNYRRFLEASATQGQVIVGAIRQLSPKSGALIDGDGALYEGLGELVDRFEQELARLTAMKGCIDNDKDLSSSHCDMLHSAYDEVLVALACLCETARDMKEAVASHDIDAEPRRASFASVDELLDSIPH